MFEEQAQSRRRFFLVGAGAGTGLFLTAGAAVQAKAKDEAAEEVMPAEDLMREHGVLNRLLLVYEECGRRLEGKRDFDIKTLGAAAGIIRRFIEDYHEKLEEDHLFPRFEKAGKLVDLVRVLRQQHDAGRRVTDRVVEAATPAGVKDAEGSRRLVGWLRQFVRMYRPHEAREDTVLFPAIRSLMTPKQYDELGERFEDREHELFGEHGFENIVGQVAELEKTLGIYDLGQFTPGA